MADGLAGTGTSETPDPADKTPEPAAAAEAGEMRRWTDVLGSTITAEALAVTATTVTFKMEDGKVVDYPPDRLSDESRQALEKSQGR